MRTRTIYPQANPIEPLPAGTSPIHRTGAESVIYHIPNTLPSASIHHLKTTILLPRYSSWTSGLHFHRTHTEYLRVVRGAITVQLGTARKTISAAAGGEIDANGTFIDAGLVITVAKNLRHNWGRADFLSRRSALGGMKRDLPKDWNGDVVVEEWTDPSDLAKPLFFWNLNGVITAPADNPATTLQKAVRWILGGWWVPFQLFLIFWELDNWPVFLSLEGLGIGTWIEQEAEFLMTFSVLLVASTVARLVGFEAVTEERTPKCLWEGWKRTKDVGKND